MYSILIRCIIFYIIYLLINNSSDNLKLFYFIIWSYSIVSNDPLINYMFISIIIYILNLITIFVEIKVPSIKRYTENNILINDGKINFKLLDKLNYNIDELLLELNNKNIKDIDNISLCIIKNNKLSIKLKDEYKPITLILDGKINYDSLSYINKDRKWVYSLLKKKNITIDKVNYAYMKNNKCFIIKN